MVEDRWGWAENRTEVLKKGDEGSDGLRGKGMEEGWSDKWMDRLSEGQIDGKDSGRWTET